MIRRVLRVPAADGAARDIDDEIRLHLELRTQELIDTGMSEDEARREAERAFGDMDLARASLLGPAVRQERRMRLRDWLRDLGRDSAIAVRTLSRARGFTAIAVITLALGIGASTALFSIVDGVLLEPLPFAEPDELVMVFEKSDNNDRNVANPANFNDWRARSRALESVSASFTAPITLLGDVPREVVAQFLSPDYFATLGAEPLLGRTFTAAEAVPEPGDGDVALISERLWHSRFGATADALGQTIPVAGGSYRVIGVMPAAVSAATGDADLWLPTDFAWADRENMGRFITVIGRLRTGVDRATADRELAGIAASLQTEHPDFNDGWSTNVVRLDENLYGDVRTPMLVLLAAVGLLLLIACVNVASLCLARAASRSTEVAVRSALGGGRTRIARGLILESLALATAAGALGVLIAWLGVDLLIASVPESLQIPRLAAVDIDGSVLGFALLASLLTGVLFGAAPVATAFRVSLAGTIREGGRGSSGGRSAGRLRAALVVAEIALSVVLLAGAGLTLRSLLELQRTDLGFDTDGVVTGRVTVRGEAYASAEQRVAFFDESIRAVAAAPGVEAAGMIWWLPLSGGVSATGYYRSDQPRPSGSDMPGTLVQAVQGDVFRAFGIPLLLGRTLDERDGAGAVQVVVVNRAFADATWPGEDPIGRQFVMPWDGDRLLEVVGVVANTRHRSVEGENEPTVYLPHAQFPYVQSANLIVRTEGSAEAAVATLVDRVQRVDPAIAVADAMPMRSVFSDAVARPRLTSLLVSIFAALALLLATVGIYGVVAYTVALRSRELSVRSVLGADTGAVVRLILGDALRLGASGVLIGLVGAYFATRGIESLLFGVRALDPAVLGLTAALLLLVTLAAALVPALRAARTDPAATLHAS